MSVLASMASPYENVRRARFSPACGQYACMTYRNIVWRAKASATILTWVVDKYGLAVQLKCSIKINRKSLTTRLVSLGPDRIWTRNSKTDISMFSYIWIRTVDQQLPEHYLLSNAPIDR